MMTDYFTLLDAFFVAGGFDSLLAAGVSLWIVAYAFRVIIQLFNKL